MKNKFSTLFTFFLILPLHIMLSTYAYFMLMTIFSIFLFLKYKPQKNILINASFLSTSFILLHLFPNFYVLFIIHLISLLLLLFQQLLPSYIFYKIIYVISLILLLRHFISSHKLLAFSIIGIFTLLRYDADLQTTIRCYFNYWFLGISALLISLLILPVAVFRPWNVKNIL